LLLNRYTTKVSTALRALPTRRYCVTKSPFFDTLKIRAAKTATEFVLPVPETDP
jgi:hypothetical protein